MEKRVKKTLKGVLKFAVTSIAFYIVFSKISWEQVRDLLFKANPIYLFLATIFFIISKVLSAIRLHAFFRCINLEITTKYHLRLYWIGMFYNLFLPGGIGGDGYKIYLLNKQYGIKVRSLVQATFIDRISGLVSLLFLAGLGLLLLDLATFPTWFKYLNLACLMLIFPVFYLSSNLLFKSFIDEVPKSILWSVGVQLMQVISALLILMAIGIFKDQLAYGVLFLISSFVSILPFTIGGLGSREITFLLGFQYFGIAESYSIALSLLFTLITALVSFGGVFVKVKS
ncbi:MAG: lysylphosphatidylglycerol synthase transmembrane domain-containing protein [Bacteroidota bacterium]